METWTQFLIFQIILTAQTGGPRFRKVRTRVIFLLLFEDAYTCKSSLTIEFRTKNHMTKTTVKFSFNERP